jgi:hypothetical protein
VFLPSPHLAALLCAAPCADRQSCARRSRLMAAAPAGSFEPQPSSAPAVAPAPARAFAPARLTAASTRLRFELPSEAPIGLQPLAASDGRLATRFFGLRLVAAGARPATGAALSPSISFRSTGRRALPGTEGATRAHVDSLTTLVSTSPRRFIAECAALCPRAGNDTLSPSFSSHSWLVTILSSSTSISQKPASH